MGGKNIYIKMFGSFTEPFNYFLLSVTYCHILHITVILSILFIYLAHRQNKIHSIRSLSLSIGDKIVEIQTFFLNGRICRGNRAMTALVITVANLTTKSVVTVTQRSTQTVIVSTAGHIRYRLYTHAQAHTHTVLMAISPGEPGLAGFT